MTAPFRAVLFDWGGTLMAETGGPQDTPMGRWPEVFAIEGARETLAALAPTFRIGIATNATVSGRSMVEQALSRVNLLEHITDFFCFTELGVRKETPAFWAHVLQTLQLPPGRVAMVGDTLEPDVLAPRRAGLHAIWFDESGQGEALHPGIPAVRRLPEVIPLLTEAQWPHS